MEPVPPPPADLGDSDKLRNLQFRLWQISLVVVTLVATFYFCTMGVFPALVTLFLTKHVLVAILAVGLERDRQAW